MPLFVEEPVANKPGEMVRYQFISGKIGQRWHGLLRSTFLMIQQDFRSSIEGVRRGSDEAIWQLIEAYGPHIQRVVRRKLDRRMRSKFDSLDFVQMVWASFFRHPSHITRFNEPDELVRFLVALAKNKVVDEYRRRIRTGKYNVNRERSLQDSEVGPAMFDNGEATPSQIAIARECWSQLMRKQSERNQSIVRLRIRGATYEEIGQSLGIPKETARSVINRLVERSPD